MLLLVRPKKPSVLVMQSTVWIVHMIICICPWQEKRMSKATEVMMQYVENLKRTYEKDHAELMEFKKGQNSSRCYAGSGDTGGKQKHRRNHGCLQHTTPPPHIEATVVCPRPPPPPRHACLCFIFFMCLHRGRCSTYIKIHVCANGKGRQKSVAKGFKITRHLRRTCSYAPYLP